MPRCTRALIGRAVMLAGAVAAVAPAAPALAAPAPALAAQPGFSLNLSGPATGVVGQPMILRAAGTTPPPPEYWYPTWLEVDAIPARVLAVCPDGYADAYQVAHDAGGQSLAFAQGVSVDPTGAFSNTVSFTPRAAGAWLICGYTETGLAGTLAGASLTVNAGPAATAPPPTPPAGAPAGTTPAGASAATAAKPANTKAPRVSRSGGRLVCSPGGWSDATGGYAYGWSVNGKAKKGAAGRKLRVTRALRGRKVACRVTASNATGSTTAVSRAVRVR